VDNRKDDYTDIEEDIQKNALISVLDFSNTPLDYIIETPPYNCFLPPQKNPLKKYPDYRKEDFKFINFCFFYPIDKPAPQYNIIMSYYRRLMGKDKVVSEYNEPQPFISYISEKGWRTIFEQPHFLMIKPYMYEGLSIEGRRLLKERSYKIKILKKE